MSKLIDQGGFGCIFYPGFNCKGDVTTESKNLVTKLQRNSFNAKNEIYIGKFIKNILNHNLFFLPVIKSCSISLASLDKEKISECNILSNKDLSYMLLELNYIKNISFEELFTNLNRSKRHILLIFFETFKYILDSISLLIDNDIVHYDIKEQNILYSTKYENPILIDFGISIPIKYINNSNIKDYFYIYGPDYYIWPLEAHVISYLLHVKDTLEVSDINKIVSEFVLNNSGLNIFSNHFKKNYLNSCIKFLKQYVNKDKNYIINKLLKFYKSWDRYSLSILYLKFLDYLFRDGFFESKFIINFSQLLLNNIAPNPNNRLTIQETKKIYLELFYINETTQNYLTLINNFKYDSIHAEKIKSEINALSNIKDSTIK
tara:strand:- start:2531 stop:3655 length:1125 start_codon:yes stop_codon:yes gene_type:complete